MNKLFLGFVKITGLPIQYANFRKKVYYEGGDKSLRKIKGPALIISNHTSVYDCALLIYTFFNRTIRTLAGEQLYKYKMLARLLDKTGGIKVDRNNFDFSFLNTMSYCLRKGQVCLIFPESRLHTDKDPQGLLEFKPSYVYLALQNNVPIIPVYTNGMYGKKRRQNKERARIIIGKPIIPTLLLNKEFSEKQNILYINNYVRDKIEALHKELDDQTKK
ncbi:MAG: 1-acyl-sn-glycerol-3-phosphate acyltransferase [Mycoplasmoidaceae bacterium]|nr:1-acyl-sn-glycerol-3-phosphate acyltransferase [Mycoplasmoidaceae bacterium]